MEVSFGVRREVLQALLADARAGRLFALGSPLPYVFRLHPPDGILLDVQVNTSDQLIQGIWLCDRKAYLSFEDEFRRLSMATAVEQIELVRQLAGAVAATKQGMNYTWVR
jgi:hypothetical protein